MDSLPLKKEVKCYRCGKIVENPINGLDSLCYTCQAKGYFFRWGTLMRDKRVGKTSAGIKRNIKKLKSGEGIWNSNRVIW